MSLYPVRMRYLLMRDFRGTVKKMKESPGKLDKEIRSDLQRAGDYAKELMENGLPLDQREELVNNLLAPTDVPDVESPDEDLFVDAMTWAEQKGAELLKERKAQRKQ